MSLGEHITGPLVYVITRTRQRDKLDTTLKAVFITLQVIDFILTALAARYGWTELNPYMQSSMGSLSRLAIIKFGVPVLISLFVPGRWLIPAILLLCCILGWNVRELILLAM